MKSERQIHFLEKMRKDEFYEDVVFKEEKTT